MDGPNVNNKFFREYNEEHKNSFGCGILHIGTCGLHTVHNSIRAGFRTWKLDQVLRSMHFLFDDAPARREDFCKVTESSIFPIPFCGHRWVENEKVISRAIDI